MSNRIPELGVLPLQLVDRITVLLLHSLQLPRESFLEGLTLLLTLRGGLGAQFLLLGRLLLPLPLLSLEFSPDGSELLFGLFLQEGQAVQLPLRSVMLLEKGDVIGDCLLVVFEEDLILDLKVLGLGELEPGHTEIVLQTGDLHFVSVDLADVELDIVSGGGVGVQLAVGLVQWMEWVFVFGLSQALSARLATSGAVVLLGGLPLRHECYLIQNECKAYCRYREGLSGRIMRVGGYLFYGVMGLAL